MTRRKNPPLTFEEQKAITQAAQAEKARKAREAQERQDRAAREKAKRQSVNASLRVHGAKIIEDGDGNMVAGYRRNCFTLLLKDRPEAVTAVQWLEELIRTASGENGQERRPDFIRATVAGAPGQNVSQTMIDADDMLAAVTEHMAPRDARMLFELLRPDEALLTRWRDVVQRCTGETNPQAQGAAVRSACAHLAHLQKISERLLWDRKQRRAEAMAA